MAEKTDQHDSGLARSAITAFALFGCGAWYVLFHNFQNPPCHPGIDQNCWFGHMPAVDLVTAVIVGGGLVVSYFGAQTVQRVIGNE